VSNFDKQSYAHDHFLVKCNNKKIKINDARVTRVGVQSDHLAIELNMKINPWRPSKQGRNNKNKNIAKTKKTKIDYKVLKEHPNKQEAFDEAIPRFVIEHNLSYPDVAEHIVQQYKKVASRNIDERQDLFQEKKISIEAHRGEKGCPI
jgi:hypothetical protein